jgi:hypothetical protein
VIETKSAQRPRGLIKAIKSTERREEHNVLEAKHEMVGEKD